jgi:serine/threonine protein kinase
VSGFQTEQFKGTDRFAVERRIGAGGMGVVYRAFDRQRNEIVAIKTIRSVEPAAIYRLKREFRAIADLIHPNFVKLYELFSSEGEWFFTMEFVEGTEFLQYVRCGRPCSPAIAHPLSESTNAFFATESSPKIGTGSGDARLAETVMSFRQHVPDRQTEGTMPPFSPECNARLRAALHQLAVALCALHDAGKLHRDLKPSNVLVERNGRVVLLDFGLATEVWRSEIDVTSKSHVLGTAPYMSPEQGAAKELTPASDWYSVGTMIYEVLSGRCPFLGPPVQVLVDKQQHDPSPPVSLNPQVPEDLNDLCMALLRRDPAARPTGREVIRQLGAVSTSRTEQTAPATPRRNPTPFVGRIAYLSELNDAFSSVEDQGTVVVHVHGKSGIGKSVLVEQFLETIVGNDRTVILAGRCHERESVPFRALDSLMDALTRYLLHLSPLEVDALMPRDVVALARVFPVLRRVEVIDHVREHSRQIPDRQELRQRAFVALRELLARLGDRKTLVLYIDDLQWGDLDSVALLDELLQPPAPPRLLLLMCYRSEERAANPVLRAVLEAQFTNGEGIDSR